VKITCANLVDRKLLAAVSFCTGLQGKWKRRTADVSAIPSSSISLRKQRNEKISIEKNESYAVKTLVVV